MQASQKTALFSSVNSARSYALAMTFTAGAAILRYTLSPLIGDQSPYLLFSVAVAFTALMGGFRPAIVATFASTLLGAFLFLRPGEALTASDYAQIGVFLAVGAALSLCGGRILAWQRALAESEERFRLLVEGSHGTAIFFVSPEGLVRSWNQGAERIKGYTAAEVIGKPLSLFYAPEDIRAGAPQELLRRAAREGHARVEGWRLRRDGSRFWAEVLVTALHDSKGILRGFSKITRDRTAEMEMKASIEESEHTSRALLESATQAIIGISPDGTIRFANLACEKMFGYRQDELVGEPIEILLPEQARARHVGQRRQYFFDAHPRSMGQGMDLTGRRKDGTDFPIEASLSMTETRQGPMAVSFVSDITRRKKIEEDLLRERSQLKSILDNSPVLVSIKDLDGNIILANRSLLETLGMAQEDLVGHNVHDLFAPEVADQIRRSDREALEAAAPIRELEKVRHWDGSWHSYLTARFPVSYLNTAEPFGVCSVSMDITEQKEAEERILHAAQHDALTGLPNRALVYEVGNMLISTAQRTGNRLAVLFFDLDRFKPVNDTYGHETGDRMLQEVARRLRGSVRASDLVGRLGGDEFIAILANIGSDQDLALSATNLLDALRQPYHVGSLELRTSPSIGISIYPGDGDDIDILIRNADAAMYHAKENGRNTYQFFTADIAAGTRRVFAIEQRLRHGIEQNEFELYYQPVVDTRTRETVGAEALIRWPQADGQVLSPGEFIAAAEASGIINQLGDWVIQEACRQHQKWREQGLPPLRIAVNVSPVQFRARNFFKHVADAVSSSRIDPSCLELEVTESTVMRQVEEAGKTLAGLKELGLHISLDDFGTGYSSLSHLAHLPIDKLKVDQSFIRNIDTDSRSLAITETVIALGKRLGVKVVAEGIESDEAFELLRRCECDLGQGYLVSAPMPADRFAEWHLEHLAQH
jgi:diguanylate cyclase (GGDEF)-like protein/PAS domain S-box-containing protein